MRNFFHNCKKEYQMLLKIADAEVVHREAFLFLRVILLKFSYHHLTSLWPVMISEMIKVFSRFIAKYSFLTVDDDGEGSRGSKIRHRPVPVTVSRDDADEVGNDGVSSDLLLAVCKFLDLLLILPMEYFELSRWGFVSEMESIGNSFLSLRKREDCTNGHHDPSDDTVGDYLYTPYVDTLLNTTSPDDNEKPYNPAEYEFDAVDEMSDFALSKPFITAEKISSVDELQDFFMGISRRIHQARIDEQFTRHGLYSLVDDK